MLVNVLRFENAAPGVPTSQLHGLENLGMGLLPDRIELDREDFRVTAFDTASVTVENLGAAPATAVVWVWYLHTIIRAFPPRFDEAALLPFLLNGAGTGGGGGEPSTNTIRIVNGSTTLQDVDSLIVVLGSSANVDIQLPPAGDAIAGRRYRVKDGDGSAPVFPISIIPDTGDTLDGDPDGAIITIAFGSLTAISDGVSAWYIV